MCGFDALVSPPLMSSRHRILEPYGSWHTTIYIHWSLAPKNSKGRNFSLIRAVLLKNTRVVKTPVVPRL